MSRSALRTFGLGRRRASLVALVALVVLGLVGFPQAGGAEPEAVPSPTVTPVGDAGIRGYPLWDSWWDLSEVGYTDEEYFISGTALHNTSNATADYTTRIIVSRPTDPARFSGTVMLDWTNVTAQFENAVDSLEAREFLIREGWAFVHVSAQSAGICCTPMTPKIWDPVRYAPLNHPGDSYANNIFSQIAKAIRSPQGVDPMAGLDVQRVLAAGQSQSATRLRTYVHQEQPRSGVIDGFLIHGDYAPNKTFPSLSVPVIQLLADSEAATQSPNQTHNYRLWEVAGAAHSDLWIGSAQVFGQGPRMAGAPKRSAADARLLDQLAGNYGEQYHPKHNTCLVGGAAFPTRYAVNAALHHLDTWAAGGPPAPEAPRFAFSGSSLARDADGNALGGIRLAPIDVPVARYVSTACALGGITVPFTEPELLLRYPTHADYYSQLAERTAENVAQGFLLPEDAQDLLERACAMRIRWADVLSSGCEDDAEPTADLSVQATGPDTCTSGLDCPWTATVRNDGPDAAADVTLTLALDGDVRDVTAAGGAWDCDAAARPVTCRLAGDLPAGSEASVSVSAIPTTAPAQVCRSARVSSATDDPNATNDRFPSSGSACVDVERFTAPGIVQLSGNAAANRRVIGVTLCSAGPFAPLEVVGESLRAEGSLIGGEARGGVKPTDPADVCGDAGADATAQVSSDGRHDTAPVCLTGRTTSGVHFRGCDER